MNGKLRGKTDMVMGGLVLGLLILAVIAAKQYELIGTASIVPGPSGADVTQIGTGDCDLSSTSANTYTAYNKELKSTAIGTPTNFIKRVDGGQIYTTSSTFIPGIKLTSLVTKSGYYGSSVDFVTQCGGTGIKQFLAANGALSINVINSDDVTLNAVGATQALGASDPGKTVTIKATESTAYAWYSNPELNYYVVGFKTANTSALDLTQITLSGLGASRVDTTAFTILGVNSYVLAWKVPKAFSNGEKQELTLKLVAASGANPGADANVTLAFYDADYYVDSATQEIGNGINDNTGANLGYASDTTATIYTS